MCSPRHARACGSSAVSRLESRFGARSELSSRLAPSALTPHDHTLLARGSRKSFAPARAARDAAHGSVAEAGGQGVVDEPDRLDDGIADGGHHDGEAGLLE